MINSVIHNLKIAPEFFKLDGSKTFEIRKNDRNYKVGDRLVMRLFSDGEYKRLVWHLSEMKLVEETVDMANSSTITAEITYITDYMQADGYVVLGLKDIRGTL